MTDDEINVAIAEACGWKIELSILQSGLDIVRDGERKPLPNYCADLNSMYEAEKILFVGFEDEPKSLEFWSNGQTNLIISFLAHISNQATARQRAEAFLRALGKWKATDKKSLSVGGATTEESSAD